MLGFQTDDKPIALASAISYWCFRCRDTNKSPAMGIKTWEYLQSSINNAAIPSRSLNDYIVYLSKKLIISTLRPKEWNKIVSPSQVILRVERLEDGSSGEILQIDSDQSLAFKSWSEILKVWGFQYGITDRHILKVCRDKPQLICLFARLRNEEDKVLMTTLKDNEVDEAIDI